MPDGSVLQVPERTKTPKGWHVHEDAKRYIIARWQQNADVGAIAEELKFAYSTVRHVIEAAQIPPPLPGVMAPNGRDLADWARTYILENAGQASAVDIARVLSVKPSRVEHEIEKSRIPPPKPGMLTPDGKVSDLGRKTILELNRANMSRRKIAQKTGLRDSPIRRVLAAHGLARK